MSTGVNGQQSKPSIWRTFQVVAWSFLGVRKESEFQQDMVQTSAYHLIAVGIVCTVLLVVGLMVLVNWVVAR